MAAASEKYEPVSPEPDSSDSGQSGASAKPVRRPPSRWIFGLIGIAIVAASAWGALNQDLKPGPLQQFGILDSSWWQYPIETGSYRRMAVVEGDINSITGTPDGRKLWAVGTGGLILHSANAGRHWVQQSFPDIRAKAAASLAGSAVRVASAGTGLFSWPTPRTGRQYAETGGSLKQQRRQTIIPRLSTLLDAHVHADGKLAWAVGTGGAFLTSNDGGRKWIVQYSGTDDNLSAVSATADGKHGWAVGDRGTILAFGESEKGLIPWNPIRNSLRDVYAFADGQGAWMVGRNGAILKVTGTGRGVTSGRNNIQNDLTGVHFHSDKKRGWIVGSRGTILATRDGGEGWTPQKSGTRNWLNGVYFSGDGQTGWAVGGRGTILTTRDGGDRWAPQISGNEGDLRRIWFSSDGTRGWIAGVGGTILVTDNGGTNWVPQAMSWEVYKKALQAYFRDGRDWKWVEATKSKPAHLEFRTKGQAVWQADDTIPARYPAPWFFAGLFVAAGFLARAVRPDPPPVVSARSVSDEYASDRPLEPGDPDPLQFGEVAEGLSRFIRNENTEPPLTIAVTGPWGTGKSSLMNLLCADLSKQGFRPVWFNAWHHQKEEHLLAALLETVRASAVPSWWLPAGWIFRFNLFFIRLKRRPHVAIILLALLLFPLGVFIAVPEAQWGAVADAVTSLFGGSDKDLKKGTTAAGILGGSSIASFCAFVIALLANGRNRLGSLGMKPASLLSSLSGRSSARDLKAQLSFRHSFAAEFADVTKALRPISIVIVIDDIDRCRPDNVLEVLEAVNFLVTSGGCYVILGMDYQWTEKCIGEAYKEIADHPTEDELAQMQGGANADLQSDAAKLNRRNDFARRYLQKLVNIEVPVPRVATEDASKIAQTRQPVADTGDSKSLVSPKQARRFALLGMWVVIWFALAAGIFGFGHVTGISIADLVSQPDKSARVISVDPSGARGNNAAPGGGADNEGAGRLYGTAAGTSFNWLIWVPVGLLAGLIVLVGIEQWRRKGSAIVRDSPEFGHALQIWTPLVFARDRTPRAIKRYLNRVRYFAMRQKSATEAGSEAKLVALAALHQFDASLLDGGTANISNSINDFLSDLAKHDPTATEAISIMLTELEKEAMKKAPVEFQWPPTDEEIQLFKLWAAGITVR